MKVTVRKCPCCGGDYGTINSDSGSLVRRIRCRCELKKEVMWTVFFIIVVMVACYFILGEKEHGKKGPIREPTGTSIHKAYAGSSKLLLAVPMWGDGAKTTTRM